MSQPYEYGSFIVPERQWKAFSKEVRAALAHYPEFERTNHFRVTEGVPAPFEIALVEETRELFWEAWGTRLECAQARCHSAALAVFSVLDQVKWTAGTGGAVKHTEEGFGYDWWQTVAYGPLEDAPKTGFLAKLSTWSLSRKLGSSSDRSRHPAITEIRQQMLAGPSQQHTQAC